MDILELLAADHRAVQALFAEYGALAEKALHSKEGLSARIFAALDEHAQLEEELFYRELETSTVTADAIREARVEHGAVETLVGSLRASGPGDAMFDTRMKALEESVAQHIAEEEEEIFPAASDLLGADRLDELGQSAQSFQAEAGEPDRDAPAIPPVPRI